jgi:NAD-dependent deacetylase
MTDSNIPEKLISRLARARRVVVLTGAGISAESGVPTFRDPGGLWQKFKPEELANVEAFLRNPELVQGWYRHRRAIVRDVHPNPGHDALARLQEMVPEFTLVTQNVDNLHQRAGSRDVIELHGNITRSYCIDCPEGGVARRHVRQGSDPMRILRRADPAGRGVVR